MFKVKGGGSMKSAVDDGAVLREELAPVGEELRVVMLAGSVRLEAGPKEDVHAMGILAGSPGDAGEGRRCSSLGLRGGRQSSDETEE
jgi:hypothetical protein